MLGGGGWDTVSRGTFGMKRATKMFSVNVADGGGGRKNKCNHIGIKAVEADSQMRSNESDRKN